jgi:hypothetical protein
MHAFWMTLSIVLGIVMAVLFVVGLVVSCLPSPEVRKLLHRLKG